MKLYKYVVPERLDVLQNGFIRFTQPEALNDPFEMRPVIKKLVGEGFWEEMHADTGRWIRSEDFYESMVTQIIDKYVPAATRQKMSDEQYRTMVQMLTPILQKGFTSRPDLMKGMETFFHVGIGVAKEEMGAFAKNVPSIINESLGALSLTERADHPLMWAHYASSHTGLVLEFDAEHPFFHEGPEHCRLQKVAYSATKPTIEVLAEGESPWIPWFYTKSKDWEYEQEWRVLRPLGSADKVIPFDTGNIHLFAFPPECVTGVIFGCRTSLAKHQEVAAFLEGEARYQHVRLYQAIQSETNHGFDIVPH
jgi:hypothetical protein